MPLKLWFSKNFDFHGAQTRRALNAQSIHEKAYKVWANCNRRICVERGSHSPTTRIARFLLLRADESEWKFAFIRQQVIISSLEQIFVAESLWD